MIILSAGEEARFGDDRLCPCGFAARDGVGWLVRGHMYSREVGIIDNSLSVRGSPLRGRSPMSLRFRSQDCYWIADEEIYVPGVVV